MTGLRRRSSPSRTARAPVDETGTAADAGEYWAPALRREELLTKRDARYRANGRALAILVVLAMDLFTGTENLLHAAAEAVRPHNAPEHSAPHDPGCPLARRGPLAWITREEIVLDGRLLLALREMP